MRLMKKLGFFFLGLSIVFRTAAQIPVSQEPRHHDVLDNGHVRLLDVHIPPGDTSLIHIHQTPSVFLVLNNVKTGSQVIQEEDQSKSLYRHDGNIWFEGFYTLPRIHRVWNRDTSEFHVMDIELPRKNFIVLDSPIRVPAGAFTILFEEKPVRVYRLTLLAGSDISLSARKGDVLLIQTTDSVGAVQVNEKLFRVKGDFFYIPSGQTIHLRNSGGCTSQFAFLEIK
jgi:hypothetical protein